MVGPGALHTRTAVLQAAPEIAAADDNTDLHARLPALLDDIADTADDVKIQPPVGIPRQGLAADFQ